jgi:putative DNA primase/helicase
MTENVGLGGVERIPARSSGVERVRFDDVIDVTDPEVLKLADELDATGHAHEAEVVRALVEEFGNDASIVDDPAVERFAAARDGDDYPRETDVSAIEAGTDSARSTHLNPEPTGTLARRYAPTDLGNAEAFVDLFGDHFRHVKERRVWHHWRDGRWRRDMTGAAERAAKEVARARLRRSADLDGDAQHAEIRWALTSQAEPRVKAALAHAATEPEIVLEAEELDRDGYLLACANGVLDLHSGKLRAFDPDDLISLGADVRFESDASCPRWERFLDEVCDGDRDRIAYLKRAVGYSITGDTSEHALFVMHGGGANGKTTFIETIKRVAGDFATTCPFDTFARARGGNGPRNDLARLHRARLVVASESGEGGRLDEATVKMLTGGDTVAARFLYSEFFEFTPGFKIWLVTNHRPKVEGEDDAIWRRIKLIPFDVSFLGREDSTLRAQLEAELPGILRWAIEGCLEWQRDGLGTADAVERATIEYREDENVLGAFLAERCEMRGWIETIDLREAYVAFCKSIGEKPLAASVLGRRLRERGIRRTTLDGSYVYDGISLS